MELLPLSATTLDRLYTKWDQIVTRREVGCCIFAPRTDRLFRLAGWITTRSARFAITRINLSEFGIEDTEDWEKIIDDARAASTGKPIAFIVTDAEMLVEQNLKLAGSMAMHYAQHQDYGLILLSENFPDDHFPLPLLQNRFVWPLYAHQEIQTFLSYLEIKFDLRLSAKQRQTIWTKCGGHIWLVKQAVRSLANDTDPWSDPTLLRRVDQIWKGLTPTQQSALEHQNLIVPATQELISWGILPTHPPTLTLLHDWIAKRAPTTVVISEKEHHIYRADLDLTPLLTPKQLTLLHFLLAHRSQIVTREQLAAVFFETADYTDWSLDQAVRRARLELAKLGIGATCLQTRKGKGYYVGI